MKLHWKCMDVGVLQLLAFIHMSNFAGRLKITLFNTTFFNLRVFRMVGGKLFRVIKDFMQWWWGKTERCGPFGVFCTGYFPIFLNLLYYNDVYCQKMYFSCNCTNYTNAFRPSDIVSPFLFNWVRYFLLLLDRSLWIIFYVFLYLNGMVYIQFTAYG